MGDLIAAVARQESSRLVRGPGIGKKSAERLLLELKGKLAPDLGGLAAGASAAPGDARSDVQQALVALGYSEREAAAAAKALPPGTGVSDGIKQALKALSKA